MSTDSSSSIIRDWSFANLYLAVTNYAYEGLHDHFLLTSREVSLNQSILDVLGNARILKPGEEDVGNRAWNATKQSPPRVM